MPLLTAHVTDHLGLYVYDGSRDAQTARARAFIDLAVERLANNPAYFLQPHELVAPALAKAGGKNRENRENRGRRLAKGRG